MRKLTTILLLAALSGRSAPLNLLRTIPLPKDVTGSFDHMTVDRTHSRLFLAAEDAHAVLVLSLSNGAVLHRIGNLTRPHAILYREDLNRIYITDGGGALKAFDGSTYQQLQSVPLAKDADSIGYDANAGLLYMDNGGKDEGQPFSLLTVVDTSSPRKLADIRVDGATLEAMALDVYRPKLYVNNKAKNRIDVIDRWKRTLIASWPVTLGKDNVAIALDEPHQRLFVACRSGHLVVFETNTGKELQAIPIGKGVDDAVYDRSSKRIYAAGDGAVTVISQADADHYSVLGDVPTAAKARTAVLVPESNRYFVAAPASASQPAAILEFEPVDVPPFKAAPVDDAITVHTPKAEELVMSVLSSHPWLRKMGLHAAPPGHTEPVIIANGNTSRLGVKSTQGDLDAVREGKTYCAKREDGAYYNMKMPMFDAQGRRIGILVMEIPFTSATDDADAIRKAEDLRSQLSSRIPDLTFLFAD
jgi:DNA-binding beta-propeller fold protein YncE